MADIANPSAAVSESVNRLGISLLQALSQKNGGNVFISPFSLATALAMLHSGARGETRNEMRKVLGYEDAGIQDEKVAEAFSGLLSSLDNSSSDSYVLSCANSLVAQQDFAVKDEYKGLLTESFRASLFLADFKNDSEKAVADINKWVGEKTNGMIPTLLNSLDSNTVMVLLNAIYFKGTWQNTFDEEATRLQDFYNGGSKSNAKKVQMMHKEFRFGYCEGGSYTVLQLPYVGRQVAMMILLPRSIEGIDELGKELTSELFKDLTRQVNPARKVKVSLPKFKFEYSKSMKETLRSLGLSKIFDGGAEFGGMSDSNLNVSDVVHKAVVEVNEEGSEAAAATAVMMAKRCMKRVETPNFVVDHPFLFAIYDTESGAVLFLGRINEL